jgi:hypothetical protein
MKFLNRDQIDTKKWDARIATSATENIFCYSWYLDAVSESWGAIIVGDYETILPIPTKQKLGIKQIYQPPFTREMHIFGKQLNWGDVLQSLSKDFKSIQFRSEISDLIENNEERKHQLINLHSDLKYSTNAKRLIKKAQFFLIQNGNNPQELIKLFKGTAWRKIESILEEDLISLEKLMNGALENGHGELIEAYDDGMLKGAGFFLKDKKRITYLKGASTDEAKKQGVMFGLMDHAIKKYSDQGYDTFDFGGSDVENVANFYKKFGATDRSYYNYTIDNLPLWYRTLKKLK